MKLIRSFYSNIYTGSAALVDKFLFFLFFLFVGRFFNETEIGKLSIALNTANIFGILSDFALPIIIQRKLSYSRNGSIFFNECFLIKAISSALYYPVFIFIIINYFDSDLLQSSIIYFAVFLFTSSNFFLHKLLGQKKYSEYFLIILITRIILILITIIGCITNVSAYIYIALFSASIFNYIILFYQNEFQIKIKIGNIRYVKKMLKTSFYIWIGLLVVFLYDKIDLLLIGNLLGNKEAGLYYVAYSFIKSITIITSFYLISGFTDLSEHFIKNKQEFIVYRNKVIFTSFVVGSIMVLFYYILGDYILKILYGDKYFISGQIVKILSFSILFMIMNFTFGVILNSMRYTAGPMFGGIISLLFNSIFNWIYIPVYGIIASAYLVVFTEIIMMIFMVFYYFWRRKKDEKEFSISG